MITIKDIVQAYKAKMADILGLPDSKNTSIFLLERKMYESGKIEEYPHLKQVLRYLHNEGLMFKDREELLEACFKKAFVKKK